MKMLSRLLRLVWLVSVARLRRLGLAPWILLSGWLAWAALQEPELLRRSDTYLLEGAAWWGGIAMVVSFTSSEAAVAVGPWIRLLCNVLAAVMFSLLLVVVLLGLDLVTASASDRYWGLLIRMSSCFVVAAWAVAALQRISQSYHWYAFAALQSMVFIGLSVRLDETLAGASMALVGGMAALASTLLTMRDPSHEYAEAK